MKNHKTIVPLISWAFFDFAETIFSANILSVFFPLWLTQILGGKPFHYSIVYSLSLFTSVILAIIVGKYADRLGKRKPIFLAAVSLSSISLIMLSRTSTLHIALAIFFFVNLFYQQSLVLYNSLLPSVSEKGNRAFSSGVGVALGYVGGAIGLYLISMVSPTETFAFVLVAFGFFFFSIPTGFFVKERPFKAISGVSVKNILKDKGFVLFILSCLFLTEAAHTIILFMSIYLNKVYGMERHDIVPVIAVAGIIAAISAPLIGKVSDRFGVKKVFNLLFPLWALAFGVFPFMPRFFVYLMGIIIGVLLASLWTTIRPILLELSPKEEVATRFALLSMSERMAAIVGPLCWGFMVEVTDYRIATFTLAIFPMIGWVIYLWHRKTVCV
ncbi:MAG: MFS transporter [Nitrospirae bacterium]|nr:MFS transporter [Nitrospirota bacterium]